MKYLVRYYWIQSDHILATPEFHHEEIIECSGPREIKEYVEKQSDGWENKYKQKKSFGFDYISSQGGVKVSEYNPKIKKI